MPSRIQLARKSIVQSLDNNRRFVYKLHELSEMLKSRRTEWKLPLSMGPKGFIESLLKSGDLRKVVFTSSVYGDIERYVWREASPYELALSVRPGMYLSHGTAVFLHGLTDQIPKTIYVNQEQSAKSRSGTLTQQGIDRAFSRKQRQSNYVLRYREWQFVVLSGKNTGGLEVGTMLDSSQAALTVTNLERTLIDIAVRPEYAGGVYQVLEAYKASKTRMSANVLLATLKKLDYLYPYHQAIGFYMQRAGYEAHRLAMLEKLHRTFDFYISHDIKDTEYDPRWRLFLPKGL